MRRVRRVVFLMFAVSVVAAAPLAWGTDGWKALDLAEPASPTDGAKVTICCVPPGHPENAKTIRVDQRAVAAHLAHGDYLGECVSECAGVSSAVPKTGQTLCYDQYVSQIGCAGTGQDGEIQAGASTSPRFTDNLDGTVKDNLTGLIWLKDTSCFGLRVWIAALLGANTLATGACGLTDNSVAGDWRLPNVRELHSLVYYGNGYQSWEYPFVVVHGSHWSSTSYPPPPQQPDFDTYGAWSVRLEGHVTVRDKGETHGVWPVRGGQ